MPQMNYKQVQKEFKTKRIKSSLKLLRIARGILNILSFLNSLDDLILRLLCVVLGFQFDVYIRLYEESYDSHYLEISERIKYQIETTIPMIGE